jgi:hypothetical protein
MAWLKDGEGPYGAFNAELPFNEGIHNPRGTIWYYINWDMKKEQDSTHKFRFRKWRIEIRTYKKFNISIYRKVEDYPDDINVYQFAWSSSGMFMMRRWKKRMQVKQ